MNRYIPIALTKDTDRGFVHQSWSVREGVATI